MCSRTHMHIYGTFMVFGECWTVQRIRQFDFLFALFSSFINLLSHSDINAQQYKLCIAHAIFIFWNDRIDIYRIREEREWEKKEAFRKEILVRWPKSIYANAISWRTTSNYYSWKIEFAPLLCVPFFFRSQIGFVGGANGRRTRDSTIWCGDKVRLLMSIRTDIIVTTHTHM